jgi:sulfotransferase family protein
LSGVLPNLLVAGVPKAGTGSLFAYFGQHPDICPSAVKEVGYFTPLRRADGTLASVESYRQNFEHWAGERYAMEATPNYCYGGERLRAGIKHMLGRPRIVISLRDPVERLWSAYTMQRTKGNLLGIGSFEEYASACEEVRRRGDAVRPLAGLSVGMYGDYIPAWLDEFGEDVRVVFVDDLNTDPRAVVAGLFRWLSIDDRVADSLDYDIRNATAHARNPAMGRAVFAAKQRAEGVLTRAPRLRAGLRKAYVRLGTAPLSETMQPEARERVAALYRESNAATAAALSANGYDGLPRWLDGASAYATSRVR